MASPESSACPGATNLLFSFAAQCMNGCLATAQRHRRFACAAPLKLLSVSWRPAARKATHAPEASPRCPARQTLRTPTWVPPPPTAPTARLPPATRHAPAPPRTRAPATVPCPTWSATAQVSGLCPARVLVHPGMGCLTSPIAASLFLSLLLPCHPTLTYVCSCRHVLG